MTSWWINRWRSDERGVALIEFALALPIMLLLFMGGTEVSRYVQAQQKIDKLANTLVDLVAQAQTVNTSALDQILTAASHVTTPLDFAQDGIVIISCVGYDSSNRLVVKWQYKGGGALLRNSQVGEEGNTATLPNDFTLDAKDNIIVSEVYFTYEPMVSDSFFDPVEFYRSAYYLPRLGALDTLSTS